MTRQRILTSVFALATAVLVTLFATGCSFSVSTANIKSARLAKDAEGTQETTVFSQRDKIFAIVVLANAPDSTVTKARWIAADVQADVPKDHTIQEVELEHGSGTLTFDLANDDLWPKGKYRVDILLDEELKESLEFTVE